ncbi:MAG TPA: ANTAR domain-containing protein [Actinomycetes bacterium]
MDYETIAQELQAARARGDRFQRSASQAVEGAALLPAALEELVTALEELRVAEEEVRVQNEQLAEGQRSVEEARDHYQGLFEFGPAPYLITDRVGVIMEANRRAAGLLGVDQHFLIGRPLAMFASGEDRRSLRDRLNRLDALDGDRWRLTVQPRQRQPVEVLVSTSVARDAAGVIELRWMLLDAESSNAGAAEQPATSGEAALSLAELARRAGSDPVWMTAGTVSEWDQLAEGLYRLVRTAVPLLRADGAGLMLADQDGVLRWITASNEAERAFEQAERELGEGPCIDAFISGETIWTADLWADPRWNRLGPVARSNKVRGVLAAPVMLRDRPIGTCNALTNTPRAWTDGDVGAIAAYAGMVGQLIGSSSDARQKGELAEQLQHALDARVLIEQAKGVLMERHGLDGTTAFARLRRAARSSSRPIAEVAREVIEGRSG